MICFYWAFVAHRSTSTEFRRHSGREIQQTQSYQTVLPASTKQPTQRCTGMASKVFGSCCFLGRTVPSTVDVRKL